MGHPQQDAPVPVAPSPLAIPAAGGVRTFEDRPPRVLVLGDSIGDQQGSHAARALREAGVEVEVVPHWGGSLFTRDQYDMGSPQPNPGPDSLMARATQMVVRFNPDVAVVYINHNYWPPWPRDAAGNEIEMGSQAFAAMAQAQLRELHYRLSQNGARVYLVEPFPYGDVPADANPVWTSYLALQPELGFGIIRAARILTTAEGRPLDSLIDCAGVPAATLGADGHLSYFAAGLMGTMSARALAEILGISLGGATAPSEPPVALLPAGMGYRMVTCDGATFEFNNAVPTVGGIALGGGRPEGDPVVAAAATAFGRRGWMVTASGAVFPLGGAEHLGNVAAGVGDAAVGVAAAPWAEGYWVATRSGVVQPFGAAPPLGDLSGQGEEVVAMASAPDRRGYWLLTASGRVEGFGSAGHFGDLRDVSFDPPLVGLAGHPTGQGYWVLDRDGRVHAFGAARDLGSPTGIDLVRTTRWVSETDFDVAPVAADEAPTQAVAVMPTVSGEGYWIALANGAVCHFGDAVALGGLHLTEVQPIQAFRGSPLYGDGPCAQRESDEREQGRWQVSQGDRVGLLG